MHGDGITILAYMYIDVDQPKPPLSASSKKVAFFQKNQLGIGILWRKLAEIGQKLDFRALCSERSIFQTF